MPQRLCTNGTAIVVPPTSEVLALLHYDGNFNDVKGNTVTQINSPSISNSVFKFGSGAGDFNGSSCIQILSSAFVFPGDLTFETWLYRKDSNEGIIFNTATTDTFGRVQFGINSSGNLYAEEYFYGNLLTSTNTVPINQWVNVAYSRSSGTLKAFIGGNEEGSVFRDSTFGSGEGMTFAAFSSGQGFLNCYFDETRITKNLGRYTTSFTPLNSAFSDS